MPDVLDPVDVDLPGGVKIPVSRWAVTIFSIFAVLAIPIFLFRYFYPATPDLLTVRQANHALTLTVAEYNKHIVDQPIETLADANGALSVRQFADGCLVVWQRRGTLTSTRLLVDPTREDVQHKDGDQVRLPAILPVVEAATGTGGRCLNPHPGAFEWKYGNRLDQCVVEVWRHWPDSCEHVQLLNACSGAWATNADGTPQVRWITCVH